MRVGLAIETDIPGGAETVLLELTRELEARGHHVVPMGPSVPEGWLTRRFAEIGYNREPVEFKGFFGLGGVPQISSLIRAHRLDVLHSHEFAMAVCGSLAARRTGCRHIITMHGGTYYAGKARRRQALRFASRLSHHTVAVSDALRRTFAGAVGLPLDSVDVVHNGVAPGSGDGSRAREALGIAPDEVLVLAVGNLLEIKGHATLVEALAYLPADGPKLVVAIAGAGPEESRLRSRAADLRVTHDLRFLGFRDDVRDLLAGADIFVMPSLSEGLPMAMIEAMLAGCAIVASDAGGIGELLNSSEVGLLVPPKDARMLARRLSELAADPTRRALLGAAASRRARANFTASAMTEKYLAMYEG